MHVLHLIAVEADSEEEAVEMAEAAIEPYGDGQVWDWYSVGGRWKGLFGLNKDGTDKNVLQFAEDPEQFRKSLGRVADSQNREFKENLDKILGREVAEADIKGLWGMEVPDKKGAAERVSASNKEFGDLFSSLTRMEKLPGDSGPNGYGMLGYYLKKLGESLCGSYVFESYFYDSVIYETRVHDTMLRCESDPEKQYLVAVDLHN
jgi:hypothetical protein